MTRVNPKVTYVKLSDIAELHREAKEYGGVLVGRPYTTNGGGLEFMVVTVGRYLVLKKRHPEYLFWE